MTYMAEQHVGALPSFESFPLNTRLANALISYAGYISKMIWPFHLAVFYPHPGMPPVGTLIIAGIILV